MAFGWLTRIGSKRLPVVASPSLFCFSSAPQATALAITTAGSGLEAIDEDKGHVTSQVPPNIPEWCEPLAEWLGLSQITDISLYHGISPTTAELLPWLSETQDMTIRGSFTKSELSFLQEINQLRNLYVYQSKVADGNLQYLPENLIRLSLERVEIGDEELNHIHRCPHLKE